MKKRNDNKMAMDWPCGKINRHAKHQNVNQRTEKKTQADRSKIYKTKISQDRLK